MPLGLGWLKTHKPAWHCSPVARATVMSKYGGETGENEKRSGSCDVERGGTEDVKVVRKRLI